MPTAFWVVIVTLCSLVAPSWALAADKVDIEPLLKRAPFTLTADELKTLRAQGAPAGLDIEVLLDETLVRYDEKGLERNEYRMIYRVLTDKGAESWGDISASYGPWYQSKPEISARVLTKEGVFFKLDPKTLLDAQASQSGGNVYSDRHRVKGPLPAVRAGAVVETLIVVQEHKPFFKAGTTTRMGLYAGAFTALSRIVVEAPSRLPIKIRAYGEGAPKEQVQTRGALRVTSFELRNLKPWSKWPRALDPADSVVPMVEVSTAKSWADVASSYAALVDEQLAAFDAKSIAKEQVQASDSPKAKIEKLLAYTHAQVRYTGLELGERSIVPNPPADTLSRHYGDCKDKAALLVGLLRAAGVDAHVALLNVGPGLDVSADLPGFGLFDHAIVYVPGKTEYWIDATDPYAALGTVPYSDQDRFALVASRSTTKLSRIPRASSQANVYEEEVLVEYPQLGKGTVRETVRGQGAIDSWLREAFDKDDEALKEQVKAYVKERYSGQVARAHSELAADVSRPYALSVEVNEAEYVETFDDGAFFEAGPYQLYSRLPETLYDTPEEELSDEEKKEREQAKDPRFIDPAQRPVYLVQPHRASIRYLLKVAEGFAWHTLPDPLSAQAEGIRVARSAKRVNEREIEVVFELEASARTIAKDKVEAVRKVLFDFGRNANVSMRFVHKADDALTNNKLREALSIHRDLMQKYPDSVPVRSRYARSLVEMGFVKPARQVADKLAKDNPSSARALWTLGYVLLFDDLGRDSGKGADFAGAEAAFRKALAADPNEELYYNALSSVLYRQALRVRPIDTKRLTELTDLYQKLRTKFDEHSHDKDLLNVYLLRGMAREAQRLAEEMEASAHRNAILVSAVAILEGASSAQRKAEQLAGGDPRSLMASATGLLALAGRYDLSKKIASMPVMGSEFAGVVKQFDAASRRAQCIESMHPAARASYDWLARFYTNLDVYDDVERITGKPEAPEGDAYSMRRLVWDLPGQYGMAGSGNISVNGPFALDVLPCFARWDVEEREGAVRVKLFAPGAPPGDDTDTFYLRKEKAGYRVFAGRQKNRTAPYSRAIMLAVAEKKLPEARVWLEWAHPMLDQAGGFKEKANFWDAIRALWPKQPDSASSDELATVGAAMSVGISVEPRDNKVLEAALKREAKVPERVRALRYLLGLNLFESNPGRATELLGYIVKEFPEDRALLERYIRTAFAAKRHDLVRSQTALYQTKYPTERFPTTVLNQVDRREGKNAEVLARTLSRLAEQKTDRGELNEVAWETLFVSDDLKDAIKLAEAACEPRGEAKYNELHTLATLYAKSGDADHAYEIFKAAVAQTDQTKIRTPDWLMLGLLAQSVGLNDVAKDAYSRVEDDSTSEVSSAALVKKLTKTLGK